MYLKPDIEVVPGVAQGLEITEEWVTRSRLVLGLAGEMDLSTSTPLRERIDLALERGVVGLVVDLREVTFIDSVSLAVLVAAKRRLEPEGRLALVVGDTYVQLVLAASALDQVFDVFEDRGAAAGAAFA
ncbi:MAG: anti-sigma factor antagonist [Solirubrobacteraceae bacterium]|nr:anti-sigma factor antagonist [Solirubrobacteraceae bacterium]